MNNGLTQITIDGKLIGIKFGLPALTMMFEKQQETPDLFGKIIGENGELIDSFTPYGYAYLLHYGYLNYCKLKEMIPEYKFEMFMDYIEEIIFDEQKSIALAQIMEIWAESRVVKAYMEKMGNAKKKNGQPVNLNPTVTDRSE